MVGADHDFSQQAECYELDSDNNEQNCQKEQRPAADPLIHEETLVAEIESDNTACDAADQPENAEYLEWSGGVTQQEFNGEKIENDFHESEYAILGFTVSAGPVMNFYFCDGNADSAGYSGYEAVELAVEVDVFDDFAAKRFQGTAVIMEFDTGHGRDEPIGHGGRDAAQKEIVLPLFSPTAHDVIPGLNLVYQQAEILGIVLEVCIQSDDDIAIGVVKSRGKSGCLTEIPPQPDNLDLWVLVCDRFQRGKRSVPASIVDKDNFVRTP